MSARHENFSSCSEQERNLWNVLGLEPGATPDEIRRAFRKKVKACHPDLGGSRSRGQPVDSIVAAYRLLERRYTPLIEHGPAGFPEEKKDFPAYDAGDGVFLFLDVSLQEAFAGRTVDTVIADVEDFCPACSGLGYVAPPGSPECRQCSGTGFQQLPWGGSSLRVVCSACSGSGTARRRRCGICRGRGRITRQRTVRIRLPRGTRDGTVLSLPGQGPWSKEKQRRDTLFVEIRVGLPESWRISGMDIHSTISVDIWTLLECGAVAVDTVDGRVSVKCLPDFLKNTEIRLQGHGWIDEEGNRGDHIARVEMVMPPGRPSPLAAAIIRWLKHLWPAGSGSIPRSLPPGSM